jgi:hypothetical protein
MEKITKIEDRENEMLDQIKDLIMRSYPSMLGYDVQYFLGRGEDTDREILVFEISSKVLGSIYRKSVLIRPLQDVEDYERDFVGKILSDFVLLGTTFLTNSIMHSRVSRQEDSDAILTHPFSKSRLNDITRN